ncbi:MAG: outer membrane lipoprotein-sorting protein [Verrucomicrobiota bacterium]
MTLRNPSFFLLPLLLLPSVAPAQDAIQLLDFARRSIASMNGTFDGSLILGSGRKRVPFVLETAPNGARRYHFNKPDEILSVVIGRRPSGALGRIVRGTDITMEDLSMWYLTWPAGKIRNESSAGMSFFVVPVKNVHNIGSYSRADVWIHQKSMGLFRVDAFDQNDSLLRRMDVEHIRSFGPQKIADRLRVSTYKRDRKVSSTYVQLVKERP